GRAAELCVLPAEPAELAERVEVFLDLTAHGDAELADGIGRRLYRDLVAPWRGRLPQSVRRLVLVPDRVLHSLPLEAPHAPADPPRYVFEDYVMAYAPSATVLAELEARG